VFLLALPDQVQWGLSNVDIAGFNQLGHVPIQEGQQQRANVGAVYISISHNDYLVIASLPKIKVVINPCTQRCDHRSNLVIIQGLVKAGLLHIDNLAAEGQNGLEASLPSLFGRTPSRISLHDEELRFRRVPDGAVC